MSKITIPKAGQIEVPDPPQISAVEFIKQVIDNINAQMGSLDTELDKASKGDNGHVKALYDCLHTIKSKAEQADMLMMEITTDPVKLERAVARIDGPGDTFQKVKKLESAVEELQKELLEGEYDYFSVVADLLVETQAQMSQFDAYVALPHIALIKRKVGAIESELRRQVQWIFREIGPLASSESYGGDSTNTEPILDLSALSKIDLVVDALGDVFRKDLLGRFAQLQLIPYEKMFKLGTSKAGLEFLDQRFAWFKYLLSMVDAKFSSIFPVSWGVPTHLFVEFCRRTRIHVGDVLAQTEKENPEANAHVAFLLKSLKSVVAFEAEMTASFSARERAESGEESTIELPESITDAFDPYLGPYVQLERQGLEELMAEVLEAESHPIEGMQPGDPYESSRKMFEYIKGSLKRCTGFSTGQTYLLLSKEFRICLQQYCESLKFRCPTPTFQQQGFKAEKRPVYILTKSIEVTLCRIIRTGEYCIDTIPALEAMMKSRIKKSFVDEVDFQAQIDAFMDMVSFSMGVLASGEVNRMDDDFKAMRKISWGTLDNVGDVSLHIKKFLRVLSDCVPRIRLTMTPVYFQQICIKLATVFLDIYYENIMMLKRICMTGGGQLLLDLNGIKEYLVKMPNIKLPEGAEPFVVSKVYSSVIDKKIKKIEVVLKLVCTEDSRMEEMFALLWPKGTTADLESINALKGTGRNILPVPLDDVKDAFKGVGTKVGQGVTTNVSKIGTKVGDGMTNAFKDIMKGNMFNDNSTHSGDNDHHHDHSNSSHTRPVSGTQGGVANKAVGDFKNAFGGAMGFMKASASSVTGNSSSGGSTSTTKGTNSSAVRK